MGKRRRLIPFGLWPANWGLEGKRRAQAMAEYRLDGEDLVLELLKIKHDGHTESMDYQLDHLQHLKVTTNMLQYHYEQKRNEIKNPDHTDTEFLKTSLEIDYKYRKINDEEYERRKLSFDIPDINSDQFKLANLKIGRKYGQVKEEEYDYLFYELTYPEDERDTPEALLHRLEVDHKYHKITDKAYEKGIATLNKEPWFDIIEAKAVPMGEGRFNIGFELDWNTFFVSDLEKLGWSGADEDQVIYSWFEEACRQMLGDENDEDEIPDVQSLARAARRSVVDTERAEYS